MELGKVFLISIVLTFIFCKIAMSEYASDSENKFVRFLYRLINFKLLILERMLKILYVFTTVLCIGIGVLMVMTAEGNKWPAGIVFMIVSVILARVIFEIVMFLFVQVDNTRRIRIALCGKLPDEREIGEDDDEESEDEESSDIAGRLGRSADVPVREESGVSMRPAQKTSGQELKVTVQPPNYVFCPECGTRYDKNNMDCPHCHPKAQA